MAVEANLMEERVAPGRTSLWVLAATNLVPVAGVALWGWDVADLVYLYWLETLIVGVFNALRIATKGVESGEIGGALVVIAAFVLHFGFFCYFQGSMIATFIPPAGLEPMIGIGLGGIVDAARAVLRHEGTALALLAIAASHAYSFARDWLGAGEYRRAGAGALMVQPYKRIAVTQVVVVGGGIVLKVLNSPLAATLLFVAAKIGFDAYFHNRERQAFAPAPAVT